MFCKNCGCKIYGGACVNCHEEFFIAEQNAGNEEPAPIPKVFQKLEEHREEIEENRKIGGQNESQKANRGSKKI